MESRLNFFLIGKTGNGKSATGNTILNRLAFMSAARSSSVTKRVSSSYREYNNYILNVIDGPGLEDTELGIVKKKEAQIKDMELALALSSGGIDAFLLVQRFGSRFTREDRSVLETLGGLFGPNYLLHVIVVVTCGDYFEEYMEEQSAMSFEEWCEKEVGEFKKLYHECDKRFVLFNNKEKDEKKKDRQVQLLVKLAQDLHKQHNRYTSECFTQAQNERAKLIINLKAPQLKEEIQEKISLLTARIEKFAVSPSPELRAEIERKIEDLRVEIKVQDKGYGVLDDLLKLVELVRQSYHDKSKLLDILKKMEDTRQSESVWPKIGSFVLKFFEVVGPLAANIGIEYIKYKAKK